MTGIRRCGRDGLNWTPRWRPFRPKRHAGYFLVMRIQMLTGAMVVLVRVIWWMFLMLMRVVLFPLFLLVRR